MGWRNLKSSGRTPSGPALDTLRRKLTKGLEVRVEQPEARRGGDVRAVVVTEPEGLGDLEVGLVCREFYDEIVSHADSASRETLDAVEYEAWQPMQCVRGEHGVTLTIPEQAPYSYAGQCLSFRWEVVARGRKRMALDAQASQEIAVRA